jgi:hypothetical protein
MANDRPRWRFRISTLMLLVIIIALGLALAIERRKRVELERRLEGLAFREAMREAVLAREIKLAPVVLHLNPQIEAFFGSEGPPPESPGRATEKAGR